jgi:riboflavin kinase/FMN adenylyltransferase
LENEKPTIQNTSLLLGDFDGVHLGHQSLVKKAKEFDEPIGALLFDVDPVFFLDNGKTKKVLSSLEERIELLSSYGVEIFYVIHTTKEFLSLSPEEFMKDVLLPLKPARLIVGSDYRFGKRAQVDAETLKSLFEVEVVSLLQDNGSKIASRDIKTKIEEGDIEKATSLLGHPFQITGIVQEGFHNGRKIGFPTINLALEVPYVLPRSGVYLSKVTLEGKTYSAITNVGTNPTVGELLEPIVESHLDGFEGESYGKVASILFYAYLREETKFASLKDLGLQLEKDMASLRSFAFK